MDELRDLSDFFENAAIALHWVGPDGTIIRVNKAELELLGYAREEYVGRNIAEFHVDPPVIADILKRLKAGETLHNYEARLRCKDGSIRDVLITSNVQWQDGEFVHTRCFTRDVTDRKRVEALQRESVDYLEGLLEGFVAYDGGWKMVYMNAAAERILGRRREDVLGKTWHQAFPHAVGNPVDQMYQRVMRTRRGETMEYFYPHYGRWMEISASPVRTGGVGVYFRDISDRKRAEAALQESEARFRTLAEAAPVLIWVNGLQGCEYVNRGYLDFTGVGESEVRGYDWAAFVHPEDRQGYLDAYRRALAARERFDAQFRFRRHDGEYRWMRSIGVPRLDAGGNLLGYVGVTVDVTDLRLAADELRAADRRKDEFLATLAHELRNPMAPIRSGLQVLQVAQPGSEPYRQASVIMERQIAHLVRLLDDLMEVSRITQGRLALQKKVIDLAEPVRTAVDASQPFVAAGLHQLHVDLPAEPVRVLADAVRIAQVVSNLLNNAAKYTPDGGRIWLSLRRHKNRAVIRVQDDGIGIAPDMLPRVFEKFAQVPSSLKRAHGGLGIGLSLARTLVELHGGTIEAKSGGEGKGAEFVVSLPALAAAPPQEERAR